MLKIVLFTTLLAAALAIPEPKAEPKPKPSYLTLESVPVSPLSGYTSTGPVFSAYNPHHAGHVVAGYNAAAAPYVSSPHFATAPAETLKRVVSSPQVAVAGPVVPAYSHLPAPYVARQYVSPYSTPLTYNAYRKPVYSYGLSPYTYY